MVKVREDAIHAKWYIRCRLKAIYSTLPSKQCLVQGCPRLFQQDNAKPHSAVADVTIARRYHERVFWSALSTVITIQLITVTVNH